jgi:hypothetical protein
VLVLGDSFTFGWGVLDDEPYPQRTEQLLRARGLEVEGINASPAPCAPPRDPDRGRMILADLLRAVLRSPRGAGWCS